MLLRLIRDDFRSDTINANINNNSIFFLTNKPYFVELI